MVGGGEGRITVISLAFNTKYNSSFRHNFMYMYNLNI